MEFPFCWFRFFLDPTWKKLLNAKYRTYQNLPLLQKVTFPIERLFLSKEKNSGLSISKIRVDVSKCLYFAPFVPSVVFCSNSINCCVASKRTLKGALKPTKFNFFYILRSDSLSLAHCKPSSFDKSRFNDCSNMIRIR